MNSRQLIPTAASVDEPLPGWVMDHGNRARGGLVDEHLRLLRTARGTRKKEGEWECLCNSQERREECRTRGHAPPLEHPQCVHRGVVPASGKHRSRAPCDHVMILRRRRSRSADCARARASAERLFREVRSVARAGSGSVCGARID